MLSIVGIVAIVIFTIQVYKAAVATGRNGPMWAVASLVVGIGVQFVIPVLIGLGFGIYLAASGASMENLESTYVGLFSIIGIGGIILSMVGMWLIMRHVSNVPDEDPGAQAPPPPPPTFNQ